MRKQIENNRRPDYNGNHALSPLVSLLRRTFGPARLSVSVPGLQPAPRAAARLIEPAPAIRFEALEPRVLLSGDVNPAALSVNGALSVPGEKDQYEFSVEESRRVVFDSLTNRSDLDWTLEGPSGQITSRKFSSTDYGSEAPAFELTRGMYLITVDGLRDAISRKGHVIDVPPQGSFTLDEAHAWMEQAGAKLRYFIDEKASLREQAAQAVQLSNSIVIAARNSMQNANGAAQLGFTTPIRTYSEWLSHFNDKKGGNELYKAIIEAAEAQTKRPGDACFVAGTLVHTRDGLVPIDKIRVGDYVLSKPESGEGELSYQRVVKTFVHADQPVVCVDVYPERELLAAQAENRLMDMTLVFPLVATANHPFWVEGKGWIRAERLQVGADRLQLADGSLGCLDDVSRIVRTVKNDIGWLIGGVFCPIRFTNTESRWVDLSGERIHTTYEFSEKIENEGVEWWEQYESDRLRRTVYNIEVENTHTYFVGEQGVWVHNKSVKLRGEFDAVALEEVRNNILPPRGTRAYYSEREARTTFKQANRGDDSQRQGVIMAGTKYNVLANNAKFQRQTEGSIVEQGE